MRKKHILRGAAVPVPILVLVVVGILLAPAPKRTVSPPAPRTLEAAQAFFDTHFQTLLTETFPGGRYRIPDIQRRYDLLVQKLRGRYGREHAFDALNQYGESTKVTMGSGLKDGVPYIQLFLPSLMDLSDAMRSRGFGAGEFERSFVIDLMHELDHLAFGLVPPEGRAPTREEFIANEQRAWAETCEHTLRPLLEAHRLTVEARHFSCYRAWVRSGRNADSAEWRRFMQSQY